MFVMFQASLYLIPINAYLGTLYNPPNACPRPDLTYPNDM
jgi:hypothetical protein